VEKYEKQFNEAIADTTHRNLTKVNNIFFNLNNFRRDRAKLAL